MAPSPASLGLAALLAAATPLALAASPRTTMPISVEAESSDFDYKNSVLVFSRVRITQGDARVEAERATATGLEFENSQWRFEGQVRITAEGGFLSSDTATVRFVDNQIAGADVSGSPARFAQQQGERRAEGHAQQIDYDLASGRVRLAGEAWLSDGNNEIRGNTLVYSMREERVLAEAAEQGGEPVRITINPKTPPGERKPAAEEQKPPPREQNPRPEGEQ
jgi:lipopolysaccharide transport protein LptA